MAKKVLTRDSINQNIVGMKNIFKGELALQADEIEKEIQKGIEKPFKEITRAVAGDCHAMGQQPITFIREVLTVCTYPPLLKDENFPEDVKKKAVEIIQDCRGSSVGAYSCSTGLEIVRKHCAQYIQKRDGIPSNPSDIILGTGAVDGIKTIISLLNHSISGKPPGIMVPIPLYPVYSAIIAEHGMEQINYYLDGDNDWALNTEELKRAIDEARKHSEPKAIVIINPGNPSGAVLSTENITEVIKFAYEEKLFLMADEVYQHNVYDDDVQFISFKKVMTEMGTPYKNMELASFMSISKGYMGECGLRGGYTEIVNIDFDIRCILIKLVATQRSPSVMGQIAMDCVVNPPQPGDPSFELFIKEKTAILESLKERANFVYKAFNRIKGIKCNKVAGFMYAFPKVYLPEKAIIQAKALNQSPDLFYAKRLLENTGICVTPGCGFGHAPGVYHFRCSIVSSIDKLRNMLEKFGEFQEKFIAEFK